MKGVECEKREGATIPQSIQIDRRRGTHLWVNWGKGRKGELNSIPLWLLVKCTKVIPADW